MANDQAKQPNILFILSDQQRWDTVECYGRPIFRGLTPNLDRMAAQGTRFDKTFTCQPVCGPLRSCLQSGLFATETGCYRNNIALPLQQNTIAHILTAQGYETGYLGKWHLASDSDHNYRTHGVPRERRGGYQDYWLAADVLEFTSHGYEGYMFDRNNKRVDFEGYRVDATTDYLLDYLRDYKSRDSGKPFFMFTSYIEPHHQNDLNRYIGPIGSKQKFAHYRTPGDLAGTSPHPGREADWEAHMPDYLGCCHALDGAVGRIRAELEALSLAENTIVIYTSDHGSHFRTRNSEYKRSCHEASIRVPFVAVGPGFTGGHVVNDLVSLIDLPATVVSCAGARVPERFRGRDVRPLVTGNANNWQDDVFVQISESCVGRAIRTDRYKYCVTAPDASAVEGSSDVYVESHLYDLDEDPHERNNLVHAPERAALRAELAQRLKQRMIAADEREPVIKPAAY